MHIMASRIAWIDTLKGIAIILVVIVHNAGESVSDFLQCFIMPLFFLLSGFLFSPKTVKEYFRKSTRRLIVPYIAYLIVIALPYIILMAINGELLGYKGKTLLINMLYGGEFLKGSFGVFWFVSVLWLATNLFNYMLNFVNRNVAGRGCSRTECHTQVGNFTICSPDDSCFFTDSNDLFLDGQTSDSSKDAYKLKVGNKRSSRTVSGGSALLVGILISIGYLAESIPYPLPGNLHVVPMATAYIGTGYWIHRSISRFPARFRAKDKICYVSISAAVMLCVFILRHELTLDMKYNNYGILGISFMSSVAASLCMACFAIVLSDNRWIGNILGFIGKASMTIMYLHQPIKFMLLNYLGLQDNHFIAVMFGILLSLVAYWLLKQTDVTRKIFLADKVRNG